jgi:hypothetical protein
VTLIAIDTPRPLRLRLTMLMLFASMLIVLILAAKGEMIPSPISCERHGGAFSNDFSADFDINRVGCRSNWTKRSPTVSFFAVSPYVSVDWENKRGAAFTN